MFQLLRPAAWFTLTICLGSSAAWAAPDWAAVAAALGKQGAEQPGGVYRVGLPRSDLQVTLDGVEVKTGLAFGGWLGFEPVGDEAMVMGDLVLTQTEIAPVVAKLREGGIEITALHNHLLRSEPATMYLHVHGQGDAVALAEALNAAIVLTATPLESPAAGEPPALDLDVAAIDGIMGAEGKNNGGILNYSIPRAETIEDMGIPVPPALGSAIVINFQPTGGGKAAIAGDFVLTPEEINPVVSALVENGIEVTALHSHMLNEEPRLFFMHFWANDDAQKLATGLRAALDHTNRE